MSAPEENRNEMDVDFDHINDDDEEEAASGSEEEDDETKEVYLPGMKLGNSDFVVTSTATYRVFLHSRQAFGGE